MQKTLTKPNSISVRGDSLKGRGVFADQDIQANELLEECHFIISGCPSKIQDLELKRYVFSLFYDDKLDYEKNEELDFRTKFLMLTDDEEILTELEQELKQFGYNDISKIFSTATVLGYGMIYNHSNTNNVDYEIDYKNLVFRFVSNQFIAKDEELFINYGNNNRDDLK